MEEEEVEVPVTKEQTKEATKMETDEAPSEVTPPSAEEADVNMQDAKGTADYPGTETADYPGSENGVPESGDKPVQMETDAKVSGLLCGFAMCWLLFFLIDKRSFEEKLCCYFILGEWNDCV